MIRRAYIRQVSTATRHASTSTKVRRSSRGPSGRSTRVDIVDEELCDTVLSRLRTTFPTPNTCDIIDVNPGLGLWSQKLHDAIQPRRHVLVEPEFSSYSEHLGPLIDQKDSKFRHTALLEDAYDPHSTLLSNYPTDGGNKLQPNSSLLMTVNLSGGHLSTALYKGTPARKFFADIQWSLWKIRNNISRYGLIRVLAWVSDDEKDAYIPRTVTARRKQAVMLEGSSLIKEVAGASVNKRPTFLRKWREIEVEDLARVAALEEAGGLTLPGERRQKPPAPDLLSIDPSPEALRKGQYSSDASWISEFLQLDDKLRTEQPEWYAKMVSGELRWRHMRDPTQKDQQIWRKLIRAATTQHTTHMKAVELILEQRGLDTTWRQMLASSETLGRRDEGRLKTQAENLKNRISKLSRTNRAFAEKAIDDYRALDTIPQVMSWNQRRMEPVLVHSGDFQPADKPLALLDVTPRTDFFTRFDTYDKMVFFAHVARTLWLNSGKSVHDALKVLVYEGLDDFVKTIPDIHDPTKGGWYDLSAVRVRSIPVEMVVEIALAYIRWPFRQSADSILMFGQDPQAAYSLGDDD
ncbi:hypothetical protein LTS07_000369 [Exophiala sideris]|uniref:rRNA adenine N(6)-methyltransferase n=1 Tax=Exophiala sideris TaxID=1016849 RepID=A0ABR0JQK4_9EURO|nr:hypothetical protein LTS07_000369 [Exophiala sideris]KAK5041426.1 hypothetical protein LTR13_002901 [Exophiala sideris]KAK5068253.1 hypothetical protein LTR69_000371 [Exophiala sideris]KAK5187554.1 hypothetical protein LTR44_000370 [Eurotiomycetes sp. CCFEE 6388]